MKHSDISESGIIGMDGQLRIPMDRLKMFFSDHKGLRVIMRIEAVEPGSSEALLGYYNNYIVPTIRAAMWETGERMSDEKTESWLREQCPFVGFTEEPRTMSQKRLLDYIEWLKQFAAEHLQVYIEEPRTI
jgi:hypothetical protein